jgi:hypothetical protein
MRIDRQGVRAGTGDGDLAHPGKPADPPTWPPGSAQRQRMAFIAPPQADMGFSGDVHAEVKLTEQRFAWACLWQPQPQRGGQHHGRRA